MFSCHLQRWIPLQFLLGEVKAMHPLGKSVKMVSWNQEDQKKLNSKLPFHDGEARERWEGRHPREDLSRGDWLFLLSILEGELQVRSYCLIPHTHTHTHTHTFILQLDVAHV